MSPISTFATRCLISVALNMNTMPLMATQRHTSSFVTRWTRQVITWTWQWRRLLSSGSYKLLLLHKISSFCLSFLQMSAWWRKRIVRIWACEPRHEYIHTECPKGNVPDFGRIFLTLKYTDITQNTYIRSWTVTEIMAREIWKYDSCYTLTDYQIHIKTARNM